MSTKPKVIKKSTALKLSKQSALSLISNTRHYVTSITGNTHFPTPSPDLASITTQVNLVESDRIVTLTRLPGSVAKLKAEIKKLEIMLKALAAYVESIANADPDHASDIIASAGMPEKKAPVRKAKAFSVVNGKLKGSVDLSNKGTLRATYIYQMTTDPNTAASWAYIYTGSNVRFTKAGLTSGTKYFFRGALSIKGVQGDWTSVLEVIVL